LRGSPKAIARSSVLGSVATKAKRGVVSNPNFRAAATVAAGCVIGALVGIAILCEPSTHAEAAPSATVASPLVEAPHAVPAVQAPVVALAAPPPTPRPLAVPSPRRVSRVTPPVADRPSASPAPARPAAPAKDDAMAGAVKVALENQL
jgi:hypothetical protein